MMEERWDINMVCGDQEFLDGHEKLWKLERGGGTSLG